MADDRCRNWTCEGYPGDSLPENYREILSDMNLQWLESPVHDKDVNPDGTTKKAHIHFLFCFEGNKSFEQVLEITNALHGPIPQKCRSVQGLVRYFIHKDNPEKWQYKKEDIYIHGNFDIDDYFKPSQSEIMQQLKLIQQFIRDNFIVEYAVLCDAIEFMDNDWFYIVTSCRTQHIKEYLRSRRYGGNQNEK